MNKILILYPSEFKCFSKFARKFRRIVQNMDGFSVIFPSDKNSFIRSLCETDFPEADLIENSEWNIEDISHAIIFDDGEEFSEELEKIKKSGKPFRLIKIPTCRLISSEISVMYRANS